MKRSSKSETGRLRLRRTAIVLLALVLPVAFAGAQQLPRYRGFVNDFAGVIDGREAQAMEQLIGGLQEATGAEIAVVTVQSYEPFGSIEEFGVALASEWGVGRAGEDNGVVIILAMQEREVRIEVGYGLEGALPDGRVGAILDQQVLPAFREGRWGAGLNGAVQGVAAFVAQEYDVDLSSLGARAPRSTAPQSQTGPDGIEIILFILILFFGGGRFFWPLLFISRRRGFFGGGFGSTVASGTRSRSTFGGSSFGGFSSSGRGGFGGGGASRRF
ncbi:MAG: TPM domain-containing protein [Spirochaetaceae bacterium]|nr:MAG: TPM domain-containing protein [Spirochaetaceae bacterium]